MKETLWKLIVYMSREMKKIDGQRNENTKNL